MVLSVVFLLFYFKMGCLFFHVGTGSILPLALAVVLLSKKKHLRGGSEVHKIKEESSYFSMRIRASTATTALGVPNNGLRSISAISGAAITNALTLAICSA